MYVAFAKFVIVALGAIPLQTDSANVIAPAVDPAPQGQVFRQTKTSTGNPFPFQSETVPAPDRVEQKTKNGTTVTFKNGELTVEAVDAPLSGVLRAIATRSGVLINAPDETGDRVTGSWGPGPLVRTIGSLLNESSFNYLIVDSGTGQPSAVQVNLYPKRGGSPGRPPGRSPDAAVTLVNLPAATEINLHMKQLAERAALMQLIQELRLPDMQKALKAAPPR